MRFIYDHILMDLNFAHISHKLALQWRLAPALILLLLLEVVFNGWRESTLGLISKPRKTDWWDICSFFAFILNIRHFFSSALAFGLMSYVFMFIDHHSLGLLRDWPLIVSVPIAFVVQDFLLYWSHRFKHRNRMLWWVHEFHHSSTRITTATNYRIHPLDFMVSVAFAYGPMQILFGWGILDNLTFILVVAFSGEFNHSRLDTDLGWLGKWLVSPRYHFRHHENNPAFMNKNFGETLRVWDLLFGTDAGVCSSIKQVKAGMPHNVYEEKGILLALSYAVWKFFEIPIKAPANFIRRLASGRAHDSY